MKQACLVAACGWLPRLALAAALASATAATAGPLADPTRPPSAATPSSVLPVAGKSRQAAPPPPVLPPPLALPQLQSVHMPAQGAALALVDGLPVRAGDTLAGRLVLAIDRQGLTLQGRAGTERLLLLAGSPKQAAGSIQDSRSAAYVPAAPNGGRLPEPDFSPRDARTAIAEQASAVQIRPASTGPLSLAGKTSP